MFNGYTFAFFRIKITSCDSTTNKRKIPTYLITDMPLDFKQKICRIDFYLTFSTKKGNKKGKKSRNVDQICKKKIWV